MLKLFYIKENKKKLMVAAACIIALSNQAEAERNVVNKDEKLVISDGSSFTGSNIHEQGAGIYNSEGSVTIGNNVSFTDNISNQEGGGIYTYKGSVTIGDNVSFKSNKSKPFGGGIYSDRSDVIIGHNATFSDNVSSSYGGAFIFNNGSLVTGNNLRVINNSSGVYGGAITIGSADITIGDDAIFQSNSTQNNGGAIWANGGYVKIGKGAQFIGNKIIDINKKSLGGAIWNNANSLFIDDGALFQDNIGGLGGALYNTGNSNTLGNNITFKHNSALEGAAVYNNYGLKFGSGTTFENNIATEGSVFYNTAILPSAKLSFGDNTSFKSNSSTNGTFFNYQGNVSFGNNTLFEDNVNPDNVATFINQGGLVNFGSGTKFINNNNSALKLLALDDVASTTNFNTDKNEAASVFYGNKHSLTIESGVVNFIGDGTLDMIDPIYASSSSDITINQNGGYWYLGGENKLSDDNNFININSGKLRLYGKNETILSKIDDVIKSNIGTIEISGTHSQFNIGSGASLEAGGMNNSISVNDGIIKFSDKSNIDFDLTKHDGSANSMLELSAKKIVIEDNLNVNLLKLSDTIGLYNLFTVNDPSVLNNPNIRLNAAGQAVGDVDFLQGVYSEIHDNTFSARIGGLTWNSILLDTTKTYNQAHGNFTVAGDSVFTLDTELSDRPIDELMNNAFDWKGNSLTKKGTGTLILSKDNKFTGITEINEGTLQLGEGGTTGSVVGDIKNNGTLALNRSDNIEFKNKIYGSGNLVLLGTGTISLSTADYSGETQIRGGKLNLLSKNTLLANSLVSVFKNTSLDANDFNQSFKSLKNAGNVYFGTASGNTITINGDYLGDNGTIYFNSILGDDNSITDTFIVKGSTSGNTNISVKNNGGVGALTTNGIMLVNVLGQSDGTFNLVENYKLKNIPTVVVGAYGYQLYKGTPTENDGNWYLRSEYLNKPNPEKEKPNYNNPIYQPGVPIYESYLHTLQAMNGLKTYRERTDLRYDTYFDLTNNTSDLFDDLEKPAKPSILWFKTYLSQNKNKPNSLSNFKSKTDIDKIEIGLDSLLHEFNDGALFAGISSFLTNGKTNVQSKYGDGKIDTKGYGIASSITFTDDKGLYIDGQSQLTWYKSNLNSKLAAKNLVKDNKAFGYSLSLEIGKKIDLDNWQITPQAQLIYSTVSFDTFNDVWNTKVNDKQNDKFEGRLGIIADKSFDNNTIYVLSNIYYDVYANKKLEVESVNFSSNSENIFGEIGLGGKYNWHNNKYSIFGQTTYKSSFKKPSDNNSLKANIGFNVKW